MKPEAQQIAIAQACGWTLSPVQIDGHGRWWRHSEQKTVCEERDLPDYLNDLNAMHEAEKVLKAELWQAYTDNLCAVCGKTVNMFFIFCATASQRAEAFLRTLNLWTAD